MGFSDKHIVDKADEWKEKEFKLKEEALRLRHKRWMAFGRFLKIAIAVLAICAALVGAGFGITMCNKASDKEEEAEMLRKAQAETEMKERLHAYETAWVRCVEELSLEECDLIREVSCEKSH